MNNKKEQELKTVHRFTENAHMKFRPLHYQPSSELQSESPTVMNKVTSILGRFFKTNTQNQSSKESTNKTFSKASKPQPQNKSKNKSSSNIKAPSTPSTQNDISTLQQDSICTDNTSSGLSSIIYLQKITIDTFIIGNYYQLDCITLSGIYDNNIDTDFNWSLNIKKKISKLAIEPRSTCLECLLAMECQGEILIYQYDHKKFKVEPMLRAKTRLSGSPKFILFLKETLLGVFYQTYGCVYQIQEDNTLKQIFHKKYGILDSLQLFQIPKPIQTTLNIFFIQRTSKGHTHILWRLQLQFKTITQSHNYKSIVRIYQIPSNIIQRLKIDNYSKNTIILNFKYEILAAKDGFIIDTANTNIQEDDSYLLYQGDKLLHISNNKIFIYSFKINLTGKPNRIEINSLDSIDIKRDIKYTFLNCLEMLNGNFVIFYQIRSEYNKKLKGEIDYTIAVTQKLSIKDKLNEIFDFKDPSELKMMGQHNFAFLQQKCDVAFKIGLNRKQVYLELWNKSNKREIQEYKFLLDTMDYETIKRQIQNKLRKSSMPFNQVYKLQQGCFDMLREDLYSIDRCTEETVKNFLISHLLLRKLVFYRNICLVYKTNTKDVVIKNSKGEQESVKVIYIDIQQYTQVCKMDLKAYFLEKVLKIQQDQNSYEKNLRMFLREFKFPLRIIYTELLEQLIIHSKSKLVYFLKVIPEILPIYSEGNQQELRNSVHSLREGLWGQIKPEEWKENLHIEQISTIHNRQLIEQITKTVWFKRNLYTQHDLITFSKQKIIQIQKSNESESTFYLLIEKVFHNEPKIQRLQELIKFVEAFYPKLPKHLKGKIFLYKNLYDYFMKEKYISSNIETFNKFLKLKDHELFKQLFKYEKIKKGCLLKDIKSIYETVKDGIQLYYEGLLHYFQSDLSEISDLKYILNRLNSEKRQFHVQNEGIYKMLIQALQLKLKLGSENDIPIGEVMIYIENIPLSKNNPILQDLKVIEMINQESERFKKMKINMSLKDIITNCQDVITALINFQIKQKKVLQIIDQQQFKLISYNILAQIQTVKDNIYKGKYKDLAYFLYLSKIMQSKEYIHYANLLLKDEYLLEYYNVDDKIIQNLVLYMYKWKFNQEPTFIKNQPYLKELLTLLPGYSQCKGYIQSEIQLAVLLSTKTYQIEYPLAKGTSTISSEEIKEIFNNYSVQNILNLKIPLIYNIVKSMQQLCAQEQIIKIQQIYQILIMRLIKLNDIKAAIPLIKTLIIIQQTNQNDTIIFCFIILQIILNQVPQNHRKKMLQIAYHLFNQPLKLLQIIDRRINVKLSNDQEQIFINQEFQKVKDYRIYNKNNILFDSQIIKKLNQKQQKYWHKFQDLCYQTASHININRDQFRLHSEYNLYFIVLINNPYALVKYISVKKDSINIKLFRSYLSYVFRQDVFHGINVLYFGRRCFTIIFEHLISLIPLEILIAEYKELSFQQDFIQDNQEIETFLKNNLFATKMKKSIEVFNKKIKSLKKIQGKQKDKEEEIRVKKSKRIQGLLSSSLSIKSNTPEEYPFQDSDDNYDSADDQKPSQFIRNMKKVQKKSFDANKQRKFLMERQTKDKNIALYLSSTGKDDQFSKTTNKNKQSKTINPFRSLHFTQRGQQKKPKESGKNYLQKMSRVDSIGNIDGDMQQNIFISQNNQDLMFHSYQPFTMNTNNNKDPISPMFSSEGFDIASPTRLDRQEQDVNQSPIHHERLHVSKLQSLIQVQLLGEDEQDGNNYYNNMKVKINEISDEAYLPVQDILKEILYDYGDSEHEPNFNLSIIINQQHKESQHFIEYLKEIVQYTYSYSQKPLLFLLQLIKQIKNHYSQLSISSQFLEYYIALQTSNIKIKAEFKIREIFPIEGLFLQSKDPMFLFDFVKKNILEHIDYDKIVILKQILKGVFKKNEINDELYISFLAKLIQQYGNDSNSTEFQLKMQKERIEGLLSQIVMTILLLEKGESLLRSVQKKERREEIIELIKDVFKQKKKNYLIKEFQKKIANI